MMQQTKDFLSRLSNLMNYINIIWKSSKKEAIELYDIEIGTREHMGGWNYF